MAFDQKAIAFTALNALIFLFLCISLGLPKWMTGPIGDLGASYKIGLFRRCDINEDGSQHCASAIMNCAGGGGDECKAFNSKTRATAAFLFFALFSNMAALAFSVLSLVKFQGLDTEKLFKLQTYANAGVAGFSALSWIIYASQKKQGESKFSSGFALCIVTTFFAIAMVAASWWRARQRGRTYTAGQDQSFGYNRT